MPKIRKNFTLDEDIALILAELAKADGRPMSNYLERLIGREWFRYKQSLDRPKK